MKQLPFKRLYDRAILPSRGRVGDAGYDLFTYSGFMIAPGMQITVPTGVATAIWPGYYGRIADRSGWSSQGLDVGGLWRVDEAGLNVGAGVIDCNYRGEIRVIIRHLGFNIDGTTVREPIMVSAGRAFAQLILERIDDESGSEWVDELPPSNRGTDGFGSSNR